MKAQSNEYPQSIIDRGKQHQINYNVVEKTIEEQTVYEFEYVLIPELSKNSLIQELMHKLYSIDDEIALINNYNAGIDTTEYDAYQTYRDECKSIANTIFS